MKQLSITFLLLSFFLTTCFNRISCDEVTDKNVIGFYYSMNAKNRNKQYLQLIDDGTFINVYCDDKVTIRELGTWERNGCEVYFNGMKCFNTPLWNTTREHSSSIYRWINGVLFLGENDVSFKKTRRKPKLICEK